eukprot:scaffold2784_cov109-Cylindrotheca_fusiformis.AAC.9
MDVLMEQPPWMLVGIAVVAIVVIQAVLPQKGNSAATASPNPYPNNNSSSASSTTSSTTASKKKRKKTKKKAKKAEEEQPPAVVEEPVVEREAPPPAAAAVMEEKEEEQPTPEPSSKKKKKKKAKKGGAPAPAPAAPKEAPPAPEVESDDEDEDDEDVTRLLNANQLSKTGVATASSTTQKKKKKKKKKKSNGASAAATSPTDAQPEKKDDENWVMVQKSNSKDEPTPTALAAAAAATTNGDAVHTVTLSLEAKDKPILVGPKGATIQNITTTSNARLDIDLPVLKITGTEGEISVAMEMVQTLLQEHKAQSAFTAKLSGKDINMAEGVKAIIGKGGSTIQQIQTNTGCKIDANIDNAQVLITGPTQEQVDKAATLCRHAVFGEHQVTLDLQDKSRVMLVLGHNFQKIREFQDASGGAKLDIGKNTTILKISGPTAAVEKAKTLVTQWLNHCAGITLNIPQSSPGSFDKVGAIYGKGGTTIRTIQDKTGAFINVDDKAGKVQISGVPNAVQGALKMVQQAMDDGCLMEEGEVRENIIIPTKAGPTVIGRGGANIKQLEKDHNVKVRISGSSCIVVGKPDAVNRCKAALDKTFEPFLEEERIQQEADRLASEQETASPGASAWNASIHEDAADGW